MGKTAKLWVRLLWDNPQQRWHEGADSQRIRKAFASLASTVTRWPTPALFWSHLPGREMPPGVTAIGPGWGRDREEDALAGMRRQFDDLGLDRWGYPKPPEIDRKTQAAGGFR